MSNKFSVIVADCPWDFKDSLKMSDVARGASSNYNVMTLSKIKELPIKDIADPDGAILALWVPSSLLEEGLNVMKSWGFHHKQTYVWVKSKKNIFVNLTSSLVKEIKKATIKATKDTQEILVEPEVHKIIVKIVSNPTSLKEILSKAISKFTSESMFTFGMGRLFRQSHEICLIGTNNNKIYKLLQNKSQRSVCFAENLKHSAKPEDLQNSLDLMFPSSRKIELFSRRVRENWVCIGNEINNGEDITESLAKLI